MGHLLRVLGFITLAASIASAAPKKVKVSTDDIRKVLKSDLDSNMVVIETFRGEKYRLRMSAQQLENLKLNIAERKKRRRIVKEAAARGSKLNVSKASTKIAKEAETTNPWTVSYTNWTTSNIGKFHRGEAAFTILNLPMIGYNLNPDYQVSFHPNFIINFDSATGATEHDLLGFQLRGTKPSTPFLFGTDLFAQVRLYLPTGETFKNSESLGAIRLRGKISKKISPLWTLYTDINPRYYVNTVASTIDEDAFGRQVGAANSNMSLRVDHGWGAVRTLNDTFSIQPAISFSHRWMLEDPNVGAEGGLNTLFGWELMVNIAATDWLSLTPSIAQEAAMSGTDSFSLFETDQMVYSLVTTFTFL